MITFLNTLQILLKLHIHRLTADNHYYFVRCR